MKLSFLKLIWRMRYTRKHPLIDPDFTWNISLGVVCVLFLGLLIWSYHLSSALRSSDAALDTSVEQLDTVDGALVKDILKFYDDRTKTFEMLKEHPTKLVDPSL
jgi:hypothetical protein